MSLQKYYEYQPNHALCLVCNTTVNRKNDSTMAMRNHLRQKHPKNWEDFNEQLLKKLNKNNQQKELMETATIMPKKRKTTQSNDESSPQMLKQSQYLSSISTTFDNSVIPYFIEDSAQKFDRLIGRMIAVDDLPLNFTENEGFRVLMKDILPNYDIQPTKTLIETLLPSLFDECDARIREKISNVNHLTLATNLWLDINKRDFLLFITVHFWHRDQLQYRVLKVCKIPVRPKGKYYVQQLKAELESYFPEREDNVHLVITDDFDAMHKLKDTTSCGSVYCIDRKIQNSFYKVIKQSEFEELIERIKKFICSIKGSNDTYSQDLKLLIDIPNFYLSEDIKLPWDLLYEFLQRFLDCFCEIERLIQKNPKVYETFGDNDIILINDIVDLLKPVFKATTLVRNPNSPLSVVLPSIITLRQLFKSSEGSQSSIKQNFLEDLNKKLEEDGVESNPSFYIATVLDPRFKLSYFEKRQEIMEKLEEFANNVSFLDVNENDHVNNEDDFFSLIREVPGSNSISNGTIKDEEILEEINGVDKVKSEINDYLSTKHPKQTNPVEFWCSRSTQLRLPILSALAEKFLSAPSTTVGIKTLFSRSTLPDHYMEMDSELLEKYLFLHYNIPLEGM